MIDLTFIRQLLIDDRSVDGTAYQIKPTSMYFSVGQSKSISWSKMAWLDLCMWVAGNVITEHEPENENLWNCMHSSNLHQPIKQATSASRPSGVDNNSVTSTRRKARIRVTPSCSGRFDNADIIKTSKHWIHKKQARIASTKRSKQCSPLCVSPPHL